MSIPAGWVQVPNTNSYSANTFTVNNVEYELIVNSETGAADLYQKNLTGNERIASTNSGNNWALTDVDRFLQTLPAGTTTSTNAAEYFATNFTLQLNQNRANLINGVNTNTSSFTNTPGVNNVAMSGTGTNPVVQSTTATSSGGSLNDIIGTLTNPLQGAEDIANSFGGNEESLFRNFLLKYPTDLLETKQDTLIITQYTYRAPQENIFQTGSFDQIAEDGLVRGTDYQKEDLGTVILPMPNRVSDSNNVGWGADNMNALNAAVGSEISNNMAQYAGGFLLGQGGQALGIPGVSGANLASAMILKKLFDNFSNQNIKTSAGAGLVSTVAAAAGYEIPAESILSRGFGIVPNSNLELLFTGPQLRQFTFAYRLSPRSETEARAVKNIIRFFKQGMAARKNSAGNNFFLGTPNIFRLKYSYNGTDEIEGVNKFKTCALAGFSVDYSPDGQWASYENGQPVSVTISMSFQELEPIYSTDYSTDKGVSDNSVGF